MLQIAPDQPDALATAVAPKGRRRSSQNCSSIACKAAQQFQLLEKAKLTYQRASPAASCLLVTGQLTPEPAANQAASMALMQSTTPLPRAMASCSASNSLP
jgi:hypothetical protein